MTDSHVPIIKAFGGSTWGSDKETMLLTYNSVIKPVFFYAPVIWKPNISKTNIGSHKIVVFALSLATSVDHRHSECEILSVGPCLNMLCRQFLASALRPAHPNYKLVLRPSGPRKIKETLSSKFLASLDKYTEFSNGVVSEV
jgi:hypothetical protein